MADYDALLVVSFGGPEGPDEVIPFLENVLRGRNVPHDRLLQVAEHYDRFGGVSPINAQNRALIAALEREFTEHHVNLPIYWGNRNWHPLLPDTIRQMKTDGVQRALAFITSAYTSYSNCRQYLENIAEARRIVGNEAPIVDRLRGYFNHPDFIAATVDRVNLAINRIDPENREQAALVFTAHSIPQSMAAGCAYEAQLKEVARLVGDAVGHSDWTFAYQSRSGPPTQPWLEPDIREHLRSLHDQGGLTDVVIAPIGFLSDHMEVIFDLDVEARAVCDEIKVQMVRAETVGTHPLFVSMVRALIEERLYSRAEHPWVGLMNPLPDVCADGCCPSGRPETTGQRRG